MIRKTEDTEIRPVTQRLYDHIMVDLPPTAAAMVDFGLDTVDHFDALYYAVKSSEITPAQLDALSGNGRKITAFVNKHGCNPQNLVFTTSWDVLQGRASLEPDQSIEKDTRQTIRKKERTRDHSFER